ncbi:unnamed protein product [Blumeria hordei]|uniref:MARVEL domain-containing protein n=2 Tax=Blumeria hordei TaxID=2867405 RepID=A0A383UZ65_BLUHO|nr:hypothetical protein BGHDH14_bgh02869 [Blumeria hordei DH14]SZF04878.1 unnamed protein product [Blumeria hordei]
MAFGLLLPLRIAQGVMALLVVSLSSYVAHWYDADTLSVSPSQVNFLVFVPIFSFISIAYLELAPRFAPKASHPFGHLAFEALNVLFYFAGFIALSVFISKLLFCRGSVCSAARADAVFASFSWLLWTGSTTLLALEVFKGGASGERNGSKSMKETPAGLGA